MKIEAKHKTPFKIISVFVAIILWFVIIYTEDPTTNVTVKDISIQLINERTLEKNGLVVVNRSELPTAAAELQGRRSGLMTFMNSVSAAADISNITEPGEYKLTVNYDLPTGSTIYITKRKLTTVTIEVEKLISKDIPIKVTQLGADKNKVNIVESSTQDKMLTITGASSDVTKIDSAVVSIEVSDMLVSNSQKYIFTYEDGNGNQIVPAGEVKPDASTIEVQNTVYTRKNMTVDVVLDKNISDDYSVRVKSLSKPTIDVGIKEVGNVPDRLELLFTVEPDENVSEYKLTLADDDRFYIPEDDKEITVKAEVVKKVEKTVSIPVTVLNSEQRSYKLTETEVEVRAKGPEAKLVENYISAKIDLSKYESGTHTADVAVTSLDGEVRIISKGTIFITVD